MTPADDDGALVGGGGCTRQFRQHQGIKAAIVFREATGFYPHQHGGVTDGAIETGNIELTLGSTEDGAGWHVCLFGFHDNTYCLFAGRVGALAVKASIEIHGGGIVEQNNQVVEAGLLPTTSSELCNVVTSAGESGIFVNRLRVTKGQDDGSIGA